MFEIMAVMCLLAASAGLLYAAWTDFKSWKIHNLTVLVLIIIYAPYAIFASQVADWPLPIDFLSAVGAGALLFSIGFVLWMLKMLGAGDAKLMFPIGLFTGWANVLPYAVSLLIVAVVALLLLKLPLPYGLSATLPGLRFDEIRKTGKVPYGVVMVTAFFLNLIPLLLAD